MNYKEAYELLVVEPMPIRLTNPGNLFKQNFFTGENYKTYGCCRCGNKVAFHMSPGADDFYGAFSKVLRLDRSNTCFCSKHCVVMLFLHYQTQILETITL
jgi:hypothetical protein